MSRLVGTLWRGIRQTNQILAVVSVDIPDSELTVDNIYVAHVIVLALTDSTAWHAGQTIRVSLGGLQAWFEEWAP